MGIKIGSLTWILQPGAATDIGVGVGTVWVIGTNPVLGGYDIFRWNGSDWEGIDGGGVRIAVSSDGTPWIVNDAGGIFVLNGGGWQQLPGAATDIAVGANGLVWIIGTNPVSGGFGIFYWDGSNWVGVDGGGVRISVGRDGTPWIVNDAGAIFVFNGGSWQQLPGAATDIAVGGTAWVIGTNPIPGGYDIFYWKGDTEWASVEGAAVAIAAESGPWVLTSEGAIFSSVYSAVDWPAAFVPV
jgi:hypothetical protein